MVTTFCQTQTQISDSNNYQLLQTSGCHCCCPCHCTPRINEFTYCALKNVCRKILREICQEQKREVYTVFDGGRCSKYEALLKDARRPLNSEKQSSCPKTKLPCNKGKQASAGEKVACQGRKKRSLAQSDQKPTKKKETNGRRKEYENIEKEVEKGGDGDTKIGRRDTESKLRKENANKIKDNDERDRLEREKADRDKAKTLKEREKAQADFLVHPCDKRSRVNRRGLQAHCGKQKRGLLVNRLDIDRDFAKRQVAMQCERFERILISSSPRRKSWERPCALSRVDSIRPCDYMRANMEFKEMCRARFLPPGGPCVPCGPCFATSSAW